MHKVYFIGAGPGNPEMLTLQGYASLQQARTVFLLSPYEETFAELLAGKDVLIPFDFDYEHLVEHITSCLKSADVAFLIPGDLTFYAPFQGLVDHFEEQSRVIAGVGVANAASAALKRTLGLPEVCQRAIIVSPRTMRDEDKAAAIEQLARPGVTLLIYMNTFSLEELVTSLRRGYGQDVPIALLHRLSLPGEEIVCATLETVVAVTAGRDLFRRKGNSRSSLTLVVVGETLTAAVDSGWWDKKRKTVWTEAESPDYDTT